MKKKKFNLKRWITGFLSAGATFTTLWIFAAASAITIVTGSIVYFNNKAEEDKEKIRIEESQKQEAISKAVEDNNKDKIPEFVPGTDSNASKATDNSDYKTPNNNPDAIGGSVQLEYTDQVKVMLDSGIISFHFKNPDISNKSMVIQIKIKAKNGDFILSETDAIKPGYIIRTEEIKNNVKHALKEGKYDGYYMIYYYDLKSGKLETVNTKIPVSIEVTK